MSKSTMLLKCLFLYISLKQKYFSAASTVVYLPVTLQHGLSQIYPHGNGQTRSISTFFLQGDNSGTHHKEKLQVEQGSHTLLRPTRTLCHVN